MRNIISAPFIVFLVFVSLSCNELIPEYQSLEVRHPRHSSPTGKITASKISLPYGGGKVKLSWESNYADLAFIKPEIGEVKTAGDTTLNYKRNDYICLHID
jgi:hypothetical protein